jgi:hypothetical protein
MLAASFMEIFQIRASSLGVYILTLLTIIFVGSAIGIALLPTKGNPPVAIALTIFVFGGAFYATRYTARALTQWTMTETEIQLRWINQFIFHNKPDLTINWGDIQEYKYRTDQYFDLFRIKLNDGKIIKLRHNTSITNDDFQKFLNAFETRVESYNKKDPDTTNDIKRAKTIYETKLGFILAILTGVCLIAIPILIVILPHKRNSWAGLIAGYSGGIFFIAQVLIHRKKKNSS